MQGSKDSEEYLFRIETPLGFSVRTTADYWRKISEIKHPAIETHLGHVRSALTRPTEVRQSRSDGSVYLFYTETDSHRWICAVAKRLNGEGFLVTAYVTDTIKEGQRIWPK